MLTAVQQAGATVLVLSGVQIMVLWTRTETSYFHITLAAKQQFSGEKLLIPLLLLEGAHKITEVVDELNAESCSWGQSVKLAGDQFETDKRKYFFSSQ